MQEYYDHVYIGAGVSNILDCIYQNKENGKNLILEKTNKIGGSWNLVNLKKNLLVENAVHYLLPNDDGLDFLQNNLNIEISEVKKKYRIFNLPIGYFKIKFNSKFSLLFNKFDKLNFFLSGRYKNEDWYNLKKKKINKSYYFKNGIIDLIQSLEHQIKINNIDIKFNSKIDKIDFFIDKNFAQIEFEGKKIFTKKVICGNGLTLQNINIINNNIKKKYIHNNRTLLRPAIHLIIKNCKMDNINEAIFLNDKVLKYCHNITSYSKFSIKENDIKILVLATKGESKNENMDHILKVLKKIKMIDINAEIIDVYYNNYYLPSWSPGDLKKLSNMTKEIFTYFITENFTYAIGKYGEKWKKKIY